MACSEAGCDGAVLARGMCSRHDKGWQRAGKPDGPPLAPREQVSCADPGCAEPAYAREHCSRHYRQLLRSGQVLEDRAPGDCAVADCERRAVTRGWCHGHYLRWSRQGDVRAAVPLERSTTDLCAIEGCDRGRTSGEHCRTHYNRLKLHGGPLAGGPIRTVTGAGRSTTATGGCPSHPNSTISFPMTERPTSSTGWSWPRRLVAPLLPSETVHHRNGDRLDNRLENLEHRPAEGTARRGKARLRPRADPAL